jgi:hypothetical protein
MVQVIGGDAVSTYRCHEQIRWEQSDRHLKQGTIVALTTHRDLMSAVRAGLAYLTVAIAYGLPGMSQSPSAMTYQQLLTRIKGKPSPTQRSELGS